MEELAWPEVTGTEITSGRVSPGGRRGAAGEPVSFIKLSSVFLCVGGLSLLTLPPHGHHLWRWHLYVQSVVHRVRGSQTPTVRWSLNASTFVKSLLIHR